MSEIKIIVDNEEIVAKEDELLIQVLNRRGIDISYFCYHDALGSDGNCRMCMVEIEGQKRPQIACDTFIKEGMTVRTKGKNIDRVRRNILELELINHPIDCPICDQAGECKLQDYYMDYSLGESHIARSDKVNSNKHIDLGSNVMLDQERCVLCARCTRFTSDITKTHELGIIGRGDHSCVSTMPNRKLDNPYAMNVVDLCPVGALTSKDFRFSQRVWFLKSTSSICQGCSTGCNIYIDHNKEKYKDDKIYRFRPRKNLEVNGHFICDEGRLSYKKLQENRQLEMVYNSDIIDLKIAKTEFQNMLKSSKNITILVDANLYTEELVAIKIFSERLDIKLISSLKSYIDNSFADDWLKSSQRASNAYMIEELAIDTAILDPNNIDLLINFNHPDFTSLSSKKSISFQTHNNFKADLILPLAVFSENSGSLTNREGVVQHSRQAIYPKNPLPSVLEWLEILDGELS